RCRHRHVGGRQGLPGAVLVHRQAQQADADHRPSEAHTRGRETSHRGGPAEQPRERIGVRVRSAVFGGVVALASSGCFTGLGPRAIHSERRDYNQEIARSADRELLINLVRLRYNESPLFLELGAVVTQYGLNANLNASAHVGYGATGDVGTGLGFTESPT